MRNKTTRNSLMVLLLVELLSKVDKVDKIRGKELWLSNPQAASYGSEKLPLGLKGLSGGVDVSSQLAHVL